MHDKLPLLLCIEDSFSGCKKRAEEEETSETRRRIQAFNNMHPIACRDGITETTRFEICQKISKSNFATKGDSNAGKFQIEEAMRGEVKEKWKFLWDFYVRSVFNILR